jgi:hypothetical protein
MFIVQQLAIQNLTKDCSFGLELLPCRLISILSATSPVIGQIITVNMFQPYGD